VSDADYLSSRINNSFITRILQEPSPLMLGAAHLAMKEHFDMNELLQHLVSTTDNDGQTRASTDTLTCQDNP
jgi:hypothetical protein